MKKIAIVSAKRTPIGRYKGKLRQYTAVELGTHALEAAIAAIDLPKETIDQVIFGNVLQGGNGQNPARQIGLKAGLPVTTPAMTVNEVCGSGLKAIILGKQLIQLGEANVVAVGGTESMSNAPKLVLEDGDEAVESYLHDGLTDAFYQVPMGITAENIAEKYGITRAQQDDFANDSQHRATRALMAEKMRSEIVALEDPEGQLFWQDEGIRPTSNVEKLATLKTVFKEDGTVTAGNSSSINDGASALILMEVEYAKEQGYPIEAILGEYAEVGCEPQLMGVAPYYAVTKLLEKQAKTIDQVDLIEMTEAFAAQSVAVKQELGVTDDQLNIYGGAIALGHPIGASGARLVTTLIHALAQEKKHSGIATACIGGGLGLALFVEREA